MWAAIRNRWWHAAVRDLCRQSADAGQGRRPTGRSMPDVGGSPLTRPCHRGLPCATTSRRDIGRRSDRPPSPSGARLPRRAPQPGRGMRSWAIRLPANGHRRSEICNPQPDVEVLCSGSFVDPYRSSVARARAGALRFADVPRLAGPKRSHSFAGGSRARFERDRALPAGGQMRMDPLALVGTLCNDEAMAKSVIVKLTDDLDGADADETVLFSLDGRSYEIDLTSANAASLRAAFKPFVEKARPHGGRGAVRSPRPVRSAPTATTMYSQLGDDEKARFRSWANMATARRISDARVKSWIAAGRP
jgi:Lsr2